MHEFNFFGDIESERIYQSDIIPMDIADFLNAANGADVTFLMNSGGGDVFAGAAMSSLIEAYSGNVTCKVLGICASMATHFATSCNKLEMSSNALWMMHNCSGGSRGEAKDHYKAAELQEKIDSQLVTAYQRKSDMSEEDIKAFMDETTWLTAAECLDLGFIDSITQSVQVAAHSSRSVFKAKIPDVAAGYFTEKSLITQKKDIVMPKDNINEDVVEETAIAPGETVADTVIEDPVETLLPAVEAEPAISDKISLEGVSKQLSTLTNLVNTVLGENKTLKADLEASKASELKAKSDLVAAAEASDKVIADKDKALSQHSIAGPDKVVNTLENSSSMFLQWDSMPDNAAKTKFYAANMVAIAASRPVKK